MVALYNEIDPFAAQWLRNLISAGLIAPGDVAECSIEDLTPNDVRHYTQVHYFAGVGVWSLALRRAGFSDDRPVWTMSCPCQPFSAAGKGAGFADERHLWPAAHWLIEQCRPPLLLGEQVASKDGLGWLDLVQADLEGTGYASRAVDLCAAGVGAPHIRQRLWWIGERLADADQQQWDRSGYVGPGGRGEPSDDGATSHVEYAPSDGRQQWRAEPSWRGATGGCGNGRLGDDDDDEGLEGQRGRHQAEDRRNGTVRPVTEAGELGGMGDAGHAAGQRNAGALSGTEAGEHGARVAVDGRQPVGPEHAGSGVGGMADDSGIGRVGRQGVPAGRFDDREDAGRLKGNNGSVRSNEAGLLGDKRAGPTNGHWRDADWLFCRDGKWRPVSPKPQPLVDGSAASLGRVCTGHVQEIEEAINAWAVETESDPYQALRDMQQYLKSAARREWPVGGLPRLHAAPFLLALLRQLTEQGWGFVECLSVSREETFEDELRVLRYEERLAGASRQHGLDGQSPGEHSNPLHFLSSLLARYAHTAWGHAYQTYAEIGFPLAQGARSRVGRLRGYGNAIVADAAQAFIEAYLGTLDERFRLTDVSLLSPSEDVFS